MTTPFIRADVAAFLEALKAGDAPPMEALPVEVARATMRQIRDMSDLPPVYLATKSDLTMPGPGGPIWLRLYDRRTSRGPGRLILFFHGGGFVIGDLETHDHFCSWLADRLDLPLLAVDYRLAPEHPFPSAIEDAEAVARWIATRPAGLDRTVSEIITCGDSAGGHLAVSVAKKLAENSAAIPVCAQWLLYPFLGAGRNWRSVEAFSEGYMITKQTMDWFDVHFGSPGDDPRYNLLLGAVPPQPLLLLTASLDPLRDQALAYASKAQEAGIEVRQIEAAGMIHGFVTLRGAMPSTRDDLEAFAEMALAMLGETHR